MTKIKLWYAPGACSLAPHIILRECDLEFELVPMKIGQTGSAFPEEFRLINPKMRVPVLGIDDNIITENPAILTAISNLCPDRKLLGKTSLDTVRAYEWMSWLSGSLHGQGYGGLLRPYRFTDDPTAIDAIKQKAMTTIQICYAEIDKGLTGAYAVGDSFTVVDAYLFVFYRWGVRSGLDMASKYPHYTRLANIVESRPSAIDALNAERNASI